MPANHGPTLDASMYPDLKSLALETLFDQMKNGKTDSDRRIAAIAALRYLTIIEDPRRKPPAPAAPKSPPPPPTPTNSPPPRSTGQRSSASPAMASSASLVFSPPRAAAQTAAQTATQAAAPHAETQTREPFTTPNADSPAAASQPRHIHPRSKRNSHATHLLPSGNPSFVSTFAPAYLTNQKTPNRSTGASP